MVRCCAAECLGRMAQVVSDPQFVAEMAQNSFDSLKSARYFVFTLLLRKNKFIENPFLLMFFFFGSNLLQISLFCDFLTLFYIQRCRLTNWPLSGIGLLASLRGRDGLVAAPSHVRLHLAGARTGRSLTPSSSLVAPCSGTIP